MNLLEILVEKKFIRREDVSPINEEIRTTNSTLEKVLVGRGLNIENILKAASEYYEMPLKQLGSTNVPSEVLSYIPEESAFHYEFVPLEVSDGVLHVGIVDPD